MTRERTRRWSSAVWARPAAAVAALTEDGHAGRLYELTGPRLLTFEEATTEIAKASGRDIRYVQVSPEQYASALGEHDLPAEVVSLLSYLFTEILDGRNDHLTNGVRRALGREPCDFTDYAKDAAGDRRLGRLERGDLR